MTGFGPALLQKKEAKLTDCITIHCSHRLGCLNKNCQYSSSPTLGRSVKKEAAFIEHRHCSKFRQEGNAVNGADITEIGVWK